MSRTVVGGNSTPDYYLNCHNLQHMKDPDSALGIKQGR